MPNQVENRIHFGVPIFEFFLPHFDVHQQNLVNLIHKLKNEENGINRSNLGGWHSDDQLHTVQDPSIKWLIEKLYTFGSKCICHHEGDMTKSEDIHLVNCWANINYKGHWNAPHHHLPQDWSGVIYLQCGNSTLQTSETISEGDIIFFDPIGPVYSANRAATINYSPQNGKVLLFPAFLLHMVAPHASENARISIAFNFKIIRHLS